MKTLMSYLVIAALSVAGPTVVAQDVPPPPPPEPLADADGQHIASDAAREKRREMLREFRRQRQHQNPGFAKGLLERLKKDNPEEYERLTTLYREDRQAFMKEMRDLMAERPGFVRPEGPFRDERGEELERKCQELSRLYHQAEDDKEKAKLKAELENTIQEAFELRLENSRRRIEHLERQLAHFKERIEALEENREEICGDRLRQLTRPPELRWDGKW